MEKKNYGGFTLCRKEQKNIFGGLVGGSGSGSCTYTSGSVSCTSSSGKCQWLYCATATNKYRGFGVCCDGTQYSNGSPCDGNLCCDA
jgi:hypothetical protein